MRSFELLKYMYVQLAARVPKYRQQKMQAPIPLSASKPIASNAALSKVGLCYKDSP